MFSNKRYKILYLITQGMLGGAQTHILHLAANLKRDFDVHVAMGIKGPLWDNLVDEGVSVYHIPSLIRTISPVKDYHALTEIIKLIKRIKPDLISTHSSKAGIIGRFAARLCGVSSIFTAHGWAFTEGVPEKQRRFYIRMERFAAKLTDKIICVSEYDRQIALKYRVKSPEHLITIHNGMPQLGDPYLSASGNENPVRLIMVARFSKQKDHLSLLKAVSELKVEKKYQVLLVGDGPLFKETKEVANQLNLLGKVKFLGARTDIPELLSKSQMFLLISNWEGFPRSILEAMRAGLSVITSDVGGANESVIDGETGFLIPRGDVETLKGKLSLLINNNDLRVKMGKRGYLRFLNNFTFEHMLDKTLAVYTDVLSEKKYCKLLNEAKSRFL